MVGRSSRHAQSGRTGHQSKAIGQFSLAFACAEGWALQRLGYGKDDMTGHGFRAAASSLLNECGKWNADAIEAQLAHVESNKIRKAYARAEYWDERINMMAWWADKCDEMRRGGLVIKFSA
jgi:integrase